MSNIDYLNNSNSKPLKKIILIVGIIILVIAIDIIFIWFLFGRENIKTQLPPVKQVQIEKSNLLDSKQITSNNITIKIPGGYKSSENNGVITITKDENGNGESNIVVDASSADQNINFENFVAGEINNLTDVVEKDLPNGKKVFGFLDGKQKLITFIEVDGGIVVIESSGDRINEAVFDAIASSIEIN